MRVVTAWFVGGCLLGAWATSAAEGQPPGERRSLLEGILRTFVEAQLDRQLAEPPRAPGTDRPSHAPGPPMEAGRRGEIASALGAFSVASNELVSALYQEAQVNSGIRPLLGDSLKLRAQANLLARKVEHVTDQSTLTTDVEMLDRHWRLLSHQLRQTANLDSVSLARVASLDEHDRRLCRLVGIVPQMDHGELLFRAVAMVTNVNNLLEDIDVDVADRQRRDALLMEGHTIRVEMDRLAEQLGRGAPHEEVVIQYRKTYELWRLFAGKTRPLASESMARSILRVDRLNREIHERLWLPIAVDRAEVTYLAGELRTRVDRFCADVSLEAILNTSRPDEATAAVSELRDLSRGLSRSASGNASLDDLLWDFRLVEVQWDETRQLLEPANAAAPEPRLVAIDDTLGALRDSMQIRPVIDRQAVVTLAAATDEWANYLNRYLRQTAGRSARYTPQFRSRLLDRSGNFHSAAHRLHEALVRNVHDDRLREHCTAAAMSWNQLAESLGELQPPDRAGCAEAGEQIAPALAELQVLVAY